MSTAPTTDIGLDVLRTLKPRGLRALLNAGHPIEANALDDTAYRGVSLGLPHWVEALAWTTFMKTFHRDPDTAVLRGWNVRLKQTGLDGEVEPQRRRNGDRRAFGHFHVVDPTDHGPPHGGQGLLIHYGLGQNGLLDPTRFLRDPIVALAPGSTERLLGWSYLDLGFAVPTPSYFLLERIGPLDHRVVPRRRPQ
jgi:hypothetical protein